MTFSKAALAATTAALFVLPIFAPPLAAQDKKTVGTIVEMQAGDVACYLTLRDDAGKRFEELAIFEICEQRSLLNKRVNLTYRRGTVIADECGGNPDCKKTRSVMLVSSAKVAAAASAPPAPAAPQAAPRAAPLKAGTHCLASETVLFSCSTGTKVASVCASGGAQGYLQLRFGTLGEAPSMTLPEGRVVPARATVGENRPFPGGGGQWLRFTSGAYAFVVYSGIGNWGPKGEKKVIEGLVVEKDGKRTTNAKCVTKPTGELQPATYEALGIKLGKKDFEFPTED